MMMDEEPLVQPLSRQEEKTVDPISVSWWSLMLTGVILGLVLAVCCPCAVLQGTMRWPLLHPSMAFANAPERYFALLLLPFAGAFWLVYSLSLSKALVRFAEERTSSLVILKLNVLLAGMVTVALVGMAAVSVLSDEFIHNCFAKLLFISIAGQCILHCILDDMMLLPSTGVVIRAMRKCCTIAMMTCATTVSLVMSVSKREQIGDWFILVALGEWSFVLCIFVFLYSSTSVAISIDHESLRQVEELKKVSMRVVFDRGPDGASKMADDDDEITTTSSS